MERERGSEGERDRGGVTGRLRRRNDAQEAGTADVIQLNNIKDKLHLCVVWRHTTQPTRRNPLQRLIEKSLQDALHRLSLFPPDRNKFLQSLHNEIHEERYCLANTFWSIFNCIIVNVSEGLFSGAAIKIKR